jgi:UDPglucose--hexose-1-phosphate uridylyltransferase
MELRSQVLRGEILHPGRGFQAVATSVEVRWDPLTGHAARLVTATTGGLWPPADPQALDALAGETQASCPFCAERIERATPKLPPAIWPQGRVRRGRAVLFPNLLAYAQHTSVSVYAPELHTLRLEELTPQLVTDNLATQVVWLGAVARHDPAAHWTSVNANHLVPSGGSLFHPHLQGTANPVASTFQQLLADLPAERFADYLATEQRLGARYLGGRGRVEWLAAFAPVGPAELRAFVPGVSAPTELDEPLVADLGWGIATALGLYAELGFESFNLALYGLQAGHPLMLRMVCRQNPRPFYRSDVMYLERLHWEAAVDVVPEELAERAGDRFRG